MGILSWALWGLFVGAFARLLRPGRQKIGFWFTVLLGIGGSILGGIIAPKLLHIADTDEFDIIDLLELQDMRHKIVSTLPYGLQKADR